MMSMGFLGLGGIAVIAAVVGLVAWSARLPSNSRASAGDTPEEIVRRRFANGEIDVKEFRTRLDDLRR